jgi:ABC-type enterochelin transport system substrate-binding protein
MNKRMKKPVIILCFLVLALLSACGNQGTPAASAAASASPSPSAANDPAIDQLLVEYEAAVTQYGTDIQTKSSDAKAADEAKLSDVSTRLSEKASDFTPEQLQKYNDITAKLGNEQ